MTGPWAVRIGLSQATAAAILRLRSDVKGAIVGDALWLRGDRADKELDHLLDLVAPHGRYAIDAGDQLRPIGCLLPVSLLPQTSWRPLSEILEPSWPAPTVVSGVSDGVLLRLVRTDREREPNALLADLTVLEGWAITAAAIRLAPLRFAATASQALVLGQPVPPIAGVRMYEADGIVVPCGWRIMPAVDPVSLRSFLDIAVGDVALFGESGWQHIRSDGFVRMTRGAVRLTTTQRAAHG